MARLGVELVPATCWYSNVRSLLPKKEWVEEFFKRYKRLIFYFIERSCNQWNLARLQLQKRDVMDDVLSEVLLSLYKDLASFKNIVGGAAVGFVSTISIGADGIKYNTSIFINGVFVVTLPMPTKPNIEEITALSFEAGLL